MRRRHFLRGTVGGLGTLLSLPTLGRAATFPVRRRGPHPTPRPGITAARVLSREQLGESPKLIQLFDQVREIPEVVDGIGCRCGCDDLEGYYSLLSCYEGTAMARHCEVCQAQARLVHRLHKQKKTLDEIRTAIDEKYG